MMPVLSVLHSSERQNNQKIYSSFAKGDSIMEIQEMFNVILSEIKEIKSSVNNLEKRFDNLEQRVDSIENKIDNLEQRVNSIENKIDILDERTSRLEKGQAEITENIVRVSEVLGKDIDNLKNETHAEKQIIGVHSVDIQLLKNKIV